MISLPGMVLMTRPPSPHGPAPSCARPARSVKARRPRSALAHDLAGEGLQGLPVVGAVAERDAEPRAAEGPERVHHFVRVLHGPPEIARAVGPVAVAEVTAEDRVGPRHSRGVDPEIEAEVHRAHDRPGVPPFGLAPPVEDL